MSREGAYGMVDLLTAKRPEAPVSPMQDNGNPGWAAMSDRQGICQHGPGDASFECRGGRLTGAMPRKRAHALFALNNWHQRHPLM